MVVWCIVAYRRLLDEQRRVTILCNRTGRAVVETSGKVLLTLPRQPTETHLDSQGFIYNVRIGPTPLLPIAYTLNDS